MNEDLTRLDYRELAYRYDLGTLKEGADIQIDETGDLKILNGDIQLGDIPHNALHRFVVSWQFNAPMLKTAFDFVSAGKANKAAHEQELNEIAGQLFGADMQTREAVIDRYHTLNQEIGIEEFGPQAYAGAIMVLLNSMLRFEWTNLGEPNRWENAGTLIYGRRRQSALSTPSTIERGYSVGQIIEAAANNFRHSDEWMIDAMAPTARQLRSIRPLVCVLGVDLADGALAAVLSVSRAVEGSNHPFGRNRCSEVLEELSHGTFEGLMNVVFPFARALAYDP